MVDVRHRWICGRGRQNEDAGAARQSMLEAEEGHGVRHRQRMKERDLRHVCGQPARAGTLRDEGSTEGLADVEREAQKDHDLHRL